MITLSYLLCSPIPLQDAAFVDVWKERERARLTQLINKLIEDNPSLATSVRCCLVFQQPSLTCRTCAESRTKRMSRSVMFSPLQNFHDLYKILLSALYIYDLNQSGADVDPRRYPSFSTLLSLTRDFQPLLAPVYVAVG